MDENPRRAHPCYGSDLCGTNLPAEGPSTERYPAALGRQRLAVLRDVAYLKLFGILDVHDPNIPRMIIPSYATTHHPPTTTHHPRPTARHPQPAHQFRGNADERGMQLDHAAVAEMLGSDAASVCVLICSGSRTIDEMLGSDAASVCAHLKVFVKGDAEPLRCWRPSSPATADRCPSGRSNCHRTGGREE